MNHIMNQDTTENRDYSSDADYVKKDKGVYAEPPPESSRSRRDDPDGE